MNKKQIIAFNLENKQYGIEIGNVIDVYEKMDAVRVPGSEDYIEGIINLRGDVVTLIDLKTRLRIDRSMEDQNVIICEVNKEKFGLTVDSLEGILDYDSSESEDKIDSGFVKGFMENKDNEIMILDLNKIITKT
ncbi:MAG: chemotaxis protein CheW [bacterium]